MKIKAFITSYDRPEMLKQVQEVFEGFDISYSTYEDGVTHPHRGKQGFFRTWNEILNESREEYADLYIFSPDDFLELNVPKLLEIHERLCKTPYACNIINDGRNEQWGRFPKLKPVDGLQKIGFVDCGFFCNAEALKAFCKDLAIKNQGFFAKPNASSGVGMQLTQLLRAARVDIYKPVKSLATHGNHESKMHPMERKNKPLISQ